MSGTDESAGAESGASHARLVWGTIALGFALLSAGVIGTQTGNVAAAAIVACLVVLPGLAAEQWSR